MNRKGVIEMSNSLKQLFDLVVWAVIVVVGGSGAVWGGYALWESINNDQPEAKKRGIIIVISTIVIVAFLIAVKNIVWGMISENIKTEASSKAVIWALNVFFKNI